MSGNTKVMSGSEQVEPHKSRQVTDSQLLEKRYSSKEAAKILCIAVKTLDKLTHWGKINYTRPNDGKRLFKESDIVDYLNGDGPEPNHFYADRFKVKKRRVA